MTEAKRSSVLAFSQDESFLEAAAEHLKGAGMAFLPVQEPDGILLKALAFKPDLILIDRAAPGSAANVLKVLRTSPVVASIPLAFVLADSSGGELVRALQAGAVEVMSKPFGPLQVDRLLQLLESLAEAPQVTSTTWEEQVARNFLAITRRHKLNGALVSNRGSPFEGRISFKEGGLVRAVYGPLTGMDAIREILQMEDGVFELDSALDRPASRIAHSATELDPGRPFLGTGDLADVRFKVLTVEDEPDLLALVSKHLSRAGFDVKQAGDGEKGVEAALATPFDLIVTDLAMPRMDGWEMLKILKADHRTHEVPVIILSAREDFRETMRAARAGAHDYLAKTGFSETIVSSALAGMTPRLEVLFELLVNAPVVEVRAQVIGLQWCLRALARLRSTGVLAVEDSWGTYCLEVENGRPVVARADVGQHRLNGLSAFARMLVARHAEGTFTHGPVVGSGQDPITMPMEELIQRTCEELNAAEARLAERRLSTATEFVVDPDLYDLFRRIASGRRVDLARAVCEGRVPPGELSEALNISADEADAGLRELLRRGVIKLPSEGGNVSPVRGSSHRRRSPPVKPSTQAPPAPLLERDVYPYVMGGLLHDALNIAVPLQHYASESPDASRTRSGLDRLVRVLQLMQEISRASYAPAEGSGSQEAIEKIVDQYRDAHRGISYSFSQTGPLNLPSGINTFLAGELLENATRACEGRPSPGVELSVEVERDGTASITCTDTGPGFTESLLEQIRSGHLPRPTGARGHGLYLMKEIVERLNGQLLCANRDEGGARVQILLPPAQERAP